MIFNKRANFFTISACSSDSTFTALLKPESNKDVESQMTIHDCVFPLSQQCVFWATPTLILIVNNAKK